VACAAADELRFNDDIRPILVENCFSCHGADSAGRKGDLRLDLRDEAVESGAIAPGDPDSSVMLDRIFSDDPEEVMPPPALKKVLSPAQKETLKRWIAEGAEYQPHWSFIPPARPEPPAVADAAWPRNPIDRFILARLEQAGLEIPRSSRPSSPTRRPMPTSGSSTGCSRASSGASTAAATGSTTPAMPTRTASTSTTIARCGPTGSG
jgi:hypothetical protein